MAASDPIIIPRNPQNAPEPELLQVLGYDLHSSTAREAYALQSLARYHLKACLNLCNLLRHRQSNMKAMKTAADNDGNGRHEYSLMHAEMRKVLRSVRSTMEPIRTVSKGAQEQIGRFMATAAILARGHWGGFASGICSTWSVFDCREFDYAWQRKGDGRWVVSDGRLVADDVKDPEEPGDGKRCEASTLRPYD